MPTRKGSEARRRKEKSDLKIPPIPAVDEAPGGLPTTSKIRKGTAEAVDSALYLSDDQKELLVPLINDLRNLSERESDMYVYEFDDGKLESLLLGVFESLEGRLDVDEQHLSDYIYLVLNNGGKAEFNKQEEILTFLKLMVKIYKNEMPVKVEEGVEAEAEDYDVGIEAVEEDTAVDIESPQFEVDDMLGEELTSEESKMAQEIFSKLIEQKSGDFEVPSELSELLDKKSLKNKYLKHGGNLYLFTDDNTIVYIIEDHAGGESYYDSMNEWGGELSSEHKDFYHKHFSIDAMGTLRRPLHEATELEQLLRFTGQHYEDISASIDADSRKSRRIIELLNGLGR